MSLLLDTHALLWWLSGDGLNADATERISDPDTLVAVSAASIWEIAIKRGLGKLDFDGSLPDVVATSGFEPLPINFEHATQAGALPAVHRDPFDRMLIAQARIEGLAIVTRDAVFDEYDVDVLRC